MSRHLRATTHQDDPEETKTKQSGGKKGRDMQSRAKTYQLSNLLYMQKEVWQVSQDYVFANEYMSKSEN